MAREGGFLLVQMLCFNIFEPWCRKMISYPTVQAQSPHTVKVHLHLSSPHRELWTGPETSWSDLVQAGLRQLISSRLKPSLKTKQTQLQTLTWVGKKMPRATPFRVLDLMCKTGQVLLPPPASHSTHHCGRLRSSILELSDEFHFPFNAARGFLHTLVFWVEKNTTEMCLRKRSR